MTKKGKPVEGQYVRKETLYLVSLLALAVGFFGGVVFSVLSEDSSLLGQSAAPVQPSAMPQSNVDPSTEIAMLEKIVAADSNNMNAWVELGNNYFDTGQYEKSIRAYKKSLELNPNNANVWTDMGVMYRRSGRPQKAIKAFDKAVEVDPKHETSRFNKGIVLLHDLQDTQGAIHAWEDLMEINPFAMAPNGLSVDQLVVGLKKQTGQQGGTK